MTNKKLCVLLFLIFTISLSAQNIRLSGTVFDAKSGKSLKFANISVTNTTMGTAANSEGRFILKLSKGKYTIIVSYIGYKSDSVSVDLVSDKVVDFHLQPIPIQLNEVTVIPGKNPALEIIKRAIEVKHDRERKLNSYIVDIYLKGWIKTKKAINTRGNGYSVPFGGSDSVKLKITGIAENESISYFKKPDYHKEQIIARKQSANFPSTINIVTGGRMTQNFYDDKLQFFNQPILSPIADNALDYYYYYIADTLAQDNTNIFKIYFAPISKSDPGLYGNIFITDKTFNLVKLVVHLNKAANVGGLLTKSAIFQQFAKFNGIYMPIDYRLFGAMNYLGIAKFSFALNTVMQDYQINPKIKDDFFNKAVVTVLPGADKKDSAYWKSTVPTPYTAEEKAAYKRIDSLEAVPTTFWQRFSWFSLLSSAISINDKISVGSPLYIYNFNRVSGHAMNFRLSFQDYFDKRLDATFKFGYGFADKKFSTSFKSKYYLGNYRTTALSFDAYNTITELFGESDYYNVLTSTVLSWFTKYDFRDYFYKKGFKVSLKSEVSPVLKLGIGFINRTDYSAVNNSDFSLFHKSRTYRVNPSIYESKINAVTAHFTLDFRDYIEDGYSRRRIWRGNVLPIISGDFYFSNKSILNSKLNFEMYRTSIYWRIPTFKTAVLRLNIDGIYTNGSVPYQMMYALPGNINAGGKSFSFRTLGINEVFGDRVASINIIHNFNDELFRLLKIPYLKDMRLRFYLYLNAAWSNISSGSKSILPRTYKTFQHPFYELGFGIGQALLPIALEFTWKLNYRGQNNFVVGINAFVF